MCHIGRYKNISEVQMQEKGLACSPDNLWHLALQLLNIAH